MDFVKESKGLLCFYTSDIIESNEWVINRVQLNFSADVLQNRCS